MNKIRIFIIIALLAIAIQAEDQQSSACPELIEQLRDDQQILNELKSKQSQEGLGEFTQDLDCIGLMVRGNYFESAKFILGAQFGKDAQAGQESKRNLSKAQAIVQSAIEYVKGQQAEVMDMLENTLQKSEGFKDNIPELSPSLRWTQSVNDTFIEVKFSTRWDSPACLDVQNHNVTISDDYQFLTISALCKNDNKYLNYRIELKLFGFVQPFSFSDEHNEAQRAQDETWQGEYDEYLAQNITFTADQEKYEKELRAYERQETEIEQKKAVAEKDGGDFEVSPEDLLPEPEPPVAPYEPAPLMHPQVSYFSNESVGRMYLNLTKMDAPSRWRRLYDADVQVKRGNIGFWWELSEKYEKELKALEKFPEDDGDDDDREDARNTKHWSTPSQKNEDSGLETETEKPKKKTQKKKTNKKKKGKQPKEQKDEL